MTMRPGPRIASRVFSRAPKVDLGAKSSSAMLPNAPRMSPRWALSSTAVWIVGAPAPLAVVCGLTSFKTVMIYSCSVLAGGLTFRVGKMNYIRAVRRGRSRLLAAVLSPGYLRARYQCDAKSGDVIEKTGALAHDAHGASNDGISKRSVQDGIDTVLLRGIRLPRRRLFVDDSHGPFPPGARLTSWVGRCGSSRRALGGFSAMPSMSARARISIHTSVGSMPAR